MPKRQCPFADSNRPQLKTHIGLEELSTGVMGLETMKDVYDRTLKMMYQNCAVSRTGQNENLPPNRCPTGQSTILPGQRKLNFLGQLDGYYTSEQCAMEVPSNGQFIPIACSSCSNIPSVPITCTFCERCLCETCFRTCGTCSSFFCADCSTLRHKPGEEEGCICLNCV